MQNDGYDASDSASNSRSSSPVSMGESFVIERPDPRQNTHHRWETANNLLTWGYDAAQRGYNWVRENNEDIINFCAVTFPPIIQGSAGFNADPRGVGLGVAAGGLPGGIKVVKEIYHGVTGQPVDYPGAFAGALNQAGAGVWGAGNSAAVSTTTGFAGAIVHGVGAGAQAVALPAAQRRREAAEAQRSLPLYRHPGAQVNPIDPRVAASHPSAEPPTRANTSGSDSGESAVRQRKNTGRPARSA